MRSSARQLGPVLIATLVAGCAANATVSPSLISSSASPLSSPSAAEAPSRSPEPAGWEQVGSFGQAGGWDRVTGLVHGNGGLLAIGNRNEPLPEGFLPVTDYLWASADGKVWEELPLPDVLKGARLASITSTPSGAFVLYANRLDQTGTVYQPIVLTSTDGRGGWTDGGSGLAEDMYIGKVVHGSAGYLLLQPQWPDHDPALWFSEDGLAWQQTHIFDQTEHWMQVSDIGAGTEGFVSVGIQIEFDEATWNRFAIASADGHEWFETGEPFGSQDPSYRPDAFVAALGPDWIATLPALDNSVRFWFSTNGLDWRPAGRIDDLGTRQAWSPVLIPAADGLFFSPNANDLPYSESTGWASTDGDSWRAELVDKAAVVTAEASGPGWAVFAGSLLTEDGQSRAAFWYRRVG